MGPQRKGTGRGTGRPQAARWEARLGAGGWRTADPGLQGRLERPGGRGPVALRYMFTPCCSFLGTTVDFSERSECN